MKEEGRSELLNSVTGTKIQLVFILVLLNKVHIFLLASLLFSIRRPQKKCLKCRRMTSEFDITGVNLFHDQDTRIKITFDGFNG